MVACPKVIPRILRETAAPACNEEAEQQDDFYGMAEWCAISGHRCTRCRVACRQRHCLHFIVHSFFVLKMF
jgi:hypothetical protein